MAKLFRFSVPWTARCVAAVALGLLVSNGASAFFFKGWPGDGLPRERTLLPPSTQITEPPGQIDRPPYVPPTEQPPVTPTLPPMEPPYVPPIEPPIEPSFDPPPLPPEEPTGGGENPPGVPEPATGLLALVGLGVATLARRRIRRKS